MSARIIVVCLSLIALPAYAELPTIGQGKLERIDDTGFPKEQRERYQLFSQRCTQCHAMSRPIAALKTGVAPVSGNAFEPEYIKKYVVKMMRKPNSGIDKTEARDIILFLRFAWARARGLPPPDAATVD